MTEGKYILSSRMFLRIYLLVVALCGFGLSQYISYPFAPDALYQPWMNVSFVSGRLSYYTDAAGFHSSGMYNGVLGITLDKTETYGFLTSAYGKTVRKLDLQTTQVGLDVTRKIHSHLLHKTDIISLFFQLPIHGIIQWAWYLTAQIQNFT